MAMGHILLVRCDAGETFGAAPSALEAAGASTVIWEALEGEPRPSLEHESKGRAVFTRFAGLAASAP